MSNSLIDREITQGVIPIGTPKAYKYDAALVEAAKASVQQGMNQLHTDGNSIISQANTILAAIRNQGGYPLKAATASAMTDTTKIYVYTGSETGYTFGDWYYHNGTAWTDGGVYNAMAFNTDHTLTVPGEAADAKVVGTDLATNNERFIHSINLLNPKKYIDGYYNSTGEYNTNSRWSNMQYIPCVAGEVYFSNTSTNKAVSFFDAEKTWLQKLSVYDSSFTVPNDGTIAYMSFAFQKNIPNYNALMLCKDCLPNRFISHEMCELKWNSLKDQNVMVFGDSISATETRWIDQFRLRLQPKTLNIFAVAGAHLRDYYNTPYPYDGNPIGTSDQLSNVVGNQVQKAINGINSNIYPVPDIAIIFAGTNDNWTYEDSANATEAQFTDDGSYINLGNVSRIYFWGALRWCVETLKTKNLNLEIIVITPIQGAEEVRPFVAQQKKVDRIKSGAERMSLKVIDAFNRCGIYGRYEYDGTDGLYLKDGLHPNIRGGVKLGNYIADAIIAMHLSNYVSTNTSWMD